MPLSRFSRFSLAVSSPPKAVPASSPHVSKSGRELALNILGQINARYLVTEVLFLLPPPPPASSPSLSFHSSLLRAALSHTLSSFPTLAGRIVASPSGRLSVLDNNAGAVFLEAAASGLTIKDIAPPPQPASGGSLSTSWTYDDFPPSLYPSTHVDRDEWKTTLMLQATRLEDDGSTVLGVWMDHAVHDAVSYTTFIHALAATVHSMQQSSSLAPPSPPAFIPPSFDADIVDRLAAPKSSYDHSGDYLRLPPVNKQQPPPPTPSSRSTFLHFSPSQLATLKSTTTNALQHLPASTRPSYISTQDALIAHLWSVLNEARGVVSSSEPLHFLQPLKIRGRAQPPIPAHYFGDTHIAYACQVAGDEASVEDVRSAEKLAKRAAAVRKRVEQVGSADYISSLLAAYNAEDTRRVGWAVQPNDPRHLLASSWTSELVDVDFGSGRVLGVYYRLPPDLGNALIILPSSDKDGGRDVWVSQTVEAYERMVQIDRVYDFAYH